MKQILLAGDSTVTGKNPNTSLNNGVCHTGWGEMLPLYVGPDYRVINFAKSGLTTDTFRSYGHYQKLLDALNPNDYVIFQFGHNDQKCPELLFDKRFRSNIIEYINDIINQKGVPILVTSPARNSWNCIENTYNDLLFDYCQSIINIGKELNVPVIDLHEKTVDWITKEGRENVKKYFYPGDFTHTNDYGAYKFAGYVAQYLLNIIKPSHLEMPWYDYCHSKIPSFLYSEVDKKLTNLESLQIIIKFNGYFAINTTSVSDEIEEIIIAKQNNFNLPFDIENDMHSFTTESAFVQLLKSASSGREQLPKDLFSEVNANNIVTIKKALEYLKVYEQKLNYTKPASKIVIAGS